LSGGARKGAGRKRARKPQTVQITVRVNPKTAEKLRAEAEQRLEERKKSADFGQSEND
jgi:hypothetical protein